MPINSRLRLIIFPNEARGPGASTKISAVRIVQINRTVLQSGASEPIIALNDLVCMSKQELLLHSSQAGAFN